MDWILPILISILILLPCVYYLFYYLPRQGEKKDNQNKAFELTKEIGNKNIRCVSVITTFNGKTGRAFYILEENAENDSTKYCVELEEGWDNSAHTIEEARKKVNEIIEFMPYHLWIEDLQVSRKEFFQPREDDKEKRYLNQHKINEALLSILDES